MYRELKREEKTILNRFFDKWDLFDYFKNKNLLVKEGKIREIFLMTEDAKALTLRKGPHLVGIKLGEIRKQVSIDLEGAQIFAQNTSKKKVVVTDEAEALVLYGRDVFGQSIIKHTNDFDENEVILITNKQGDAIGIGRTRYSADKIRNKGVTVTNIADRGWYLREENKYEI
ncbi:MAG: PUA domain-containing protein [Nitrososphaerales archaeon]